MFDAREVHGIIVKLAPELANGGRFPGRPSFMHPSAIDAFLTEVDAWVPYAFRRAKRSTVGRTLFADLDVNGVPDHDAQTVTRALERLEPVRESAVNAIAAIDGFSKAAAKVRNTARHGALLTAMQTTQAALAEAEQLAGSYKVLFYDPPLPDNFRDRLSYFRSITWAAAVEWRRDLVHTSLADRLKIRANEERAKVRAPATALTTKLQELINLWKGPLATAFPPRRLGSFPNNYRFDGLMASTRKFAFRERIIWLRLFDDVGPTAVELDATKFVQETDSDIYLARRRLLSDLGVIAAGGIEVGAVLEREERSTLRQALLGAGVASDESIAAFVERTHVAARGSGVNRDREAGRTRGAAG